MGMSTGCSVVEAIPLAPLQQDLHMGDTGRWAQGREALYKVFVAHLPPPPVNTRGISLSRTATPI